MLLILDRKRESALAVQRAGDFSDDCSVIVVDLALVAAGLVSMGVPVFGVPGACIAEFQFLPEVQ